MAGLLALLDDVAAIAKISAASIDDVGAMSLKAGAKAAGAVIDDAAVTPKYVQGFDPDREIPIVWKIAKGSIFNKIVLLLPIALLLSAFAEWAISPLLMLGGSYLCFEGAEKVWHLIHPSKNDHVDAQQLGDATQLEEQQVKGAIKTDFILSAEIMTIALASIPEEHNILIEALVLALVGLAITVAVYGFVALIVKADDYGVALAKTRTGFLAASGRAIVRVMPKFMTALTIVGTAAMIWVGGNIVIHGLHELGQHQPYEWIREHAEAAAATLPAIGGVANWFTTAFFDGVFGLIWGLILIPVATYVISPIFRLFSRDKGPQKAAH
ncbi:MAG: DUF808 domain-containing protein [Paracoccus denitrificans]|nr:MAG: DUF808 domain-containing protein [Paracoccus denitrificans]PZO82942.1 MAG: DUF808 domain-containing protein [Paracoccus denitrificans]